MKERYCESLLKKLENYENQAYKDSIGDEWLETIGEGIKVYVKHCCDNEERVTMKGFIKYLDDKWREFYPD